VKATLLQAHDHAQLPFITCLKSEIAQKLHRIHSEELWLWHAGDPLRVSVFPDGEGAPSSFTLGPNPDNGFQLQGVVAAGDWFGAMHVSRSPLGYSLVSCVVSPGFDFSDFSFADREDLLGRFPEHHAMIENLT